MANKYSDRLRNAFVECDRRESGMGHFMHVTKMQCAANRWAATRSASAVDSSARVRELAEGLKNALDRIAALESRLGAHVPSFVEVMDAIQIVKANTLTLFGMEGNIVQDCDQEVASDRYYYTFQVVDAANLDTSLRRYEEWHRQLSKVPPATRGLFRLSVTAK